MLPLRGGRPAGPAAAPEPPGAGTVSWKLAHAMRGAPWPCGRDTIGANLRARRVRERAARRPARRCGRGRGERRH
jgi:hypothetical protein